MAGPAERSNPYSNKKPNSSGNSFAGRWIGVFSGIGLLLIGVVLMVWSFIVEKSASGSGTAPDLWYEPWLIEVGTSLSVAGLLIATLDSMLHRKVMHSISQIRDTSFRSLIEGFVPGPIYDEIRSHIMSSPFLRDNFKVIIEITENDSLQEDTVRLNTAFSYRVKNLLQSEQNYKVVFWAELSRMDINSPSAIFDKLELRSKEGFKPRRIASSQPTMSSRNLTSRDYDLENKNGDVVVTFNREQIKELDAPDNDEGIKGIAADVQLSAGQELWVDTQITFIDGIRDFRPIIAAYATLGMQVVVSFPSSIVVETYVQHPAGEDAFKKTTLSNMMSWETEQGLLPYQGLQVSWHPAPDNTQATVTDENLPDTVDTDEEAQPQDGDTDTSTDEASQEDEENKADDPA